MGSLDGPSVSIITATCNSAVHLEETIQSIRRQRYRAQQYVVIDGGSSDGTLEVCSRHRDIIDYLVSEPDQGISDAFNKGVSACTSDIVGIVSSDDYLLPGALGAVAKCYLENGRPDVMHGNCIYLDPVSGRTSLSRPDPTLRSAFTGQPVKHGATFVAREAYLKYGVFDLRYRAAMDYDLILRFITKGARFAYIDQALAVIRSGGTCFRLRSLTRRESRDISVRNGYPRWRADAVLAQKVVKDVAKQYIDTSILRGLGASYRRHVGRNVPIE